MGAGPKREAKAEQPHFTGWTAGTPTKKPVDREGTLPKGCRATPTPGTETARTAVPIPEQLALMLSAELARTGAVILVTNEIGRPATPWAIERAMRDVRGSVEGLPEGFRFHDLRHYFASMLIAAGLDVKVVQARLRHASATTTLNVYGHLWPDSDESSRATVAVALAAREDRSRQERWSADVSAGQPTGELRCRSTSRTRAGAAGSESGRPRSCASTRSRSR
jgi:hypothetical protein